MPGLVLPGCGGLVHAVQGEHLIRYTHQDVLPRLRQALDELRAEAAASGEHFYSLGARDLGAPQTTRT